jgi:hypothetical protein
MEKFIDRLREHVFSEAIFLAGLTAFIYFTLYVYKLGQYTEAGLPYDLIIIGVQDYLSALGIAFTFFCLTIVVLKAFEPLYKENKRVKENMFFLTLSLTTSFFAFILLPIEILKNNYLYFGITIFTIFAVLILPLLTESKVKGYPNKLLSRAEVLDKKGTSDSITLFVLTMLLFIVGMYAAGANSVRSGFAYYLSDSNERIYLFQDDYAIVGDDRLPKNERVYRIISTEGVTYRVVKGDSRN